MLDGSIFGRRSEINIHESKICSEILKELSKDLTISLHYLNLRLMFNPNNLYTILEICKQIKIKKLLISSNSPYNLDYLVDNLNIIKNFIKENNNLEFFTYNLGSVGASNLKLIMKVIRILKILLEKLNHLLKW